MNETSIYSNSGKYKDELYLALDKHSKNTDVFIATAFFTQHEYIKELSLNRCNVYLVVRLGFLHLLLRYEKYLVYVMCLCGTSLLLVFILSYTSLRR